VAIGSITIKIGAQTAGAVREISNVNDALGKQMTAGQKASAAIRAAAKPAAIAFAAVSAAAIKWAMMAAKANAAQAEFEGALRRTTGATDEQVKAANTYLASMSRMAAVSKGELRPAYLALASATQNTAQAQKLLGIALDISAQYHVPLAKATKALVAAEQGRYTQLQRMVPGLSKAAIASKDFAAVQAQLAEMTRGAAAESAQTATGRYRAFELQMKATQIAIGQGFLPVLEAALPIMTAFGALAKDHATTISALMKVVLVLSGAILALNAGLKVYNTVTDTAAAVTRIYQSIVQSTTLKVVAIRVATAAYAAAQWLLNAAMSANPIGLLVVALAALTAGLILAYKNSQTFRNIVGSLMGWISGTAIAIWHGLTAAVNALPAAFRAVWTVASTLLNVYFLPLKVQILALEAAWNVLSAALGRLGVWSALGAAIGRISSAISYLVGQVQSLISWISRIKWPSVPKFLSKLPGAPFMAPLPPAGAASLFAYPARRSGLPTGRAQTATASYTVNVYGAVDPEGTARAIRRVLEAHDRRQGRIT